MNKKHPATSESAHTCCCWLLLLLLLELLVLVHLGFQLERRLLVEALVGSLGALLAHLEQVARNIARDHEQGRRQETAAERCFDFSTVDLNLHADVVREGFAASTHITRETDRDRVSGQSIDTAI